MQLVKVTEEAHRQTSEPSGESPSVTALLCVKTFSHFAEYVHIYIGFYIWIKFEVSLKHFV